MYYCFIVQVEFVLKGIFNLFQVESIHLWKNKVFNITKDLQCYNFSTFQREDGAEDPKNFIISLLQKPS